MTLELEFKSGRLCQLITLLSIGSFQENSQEKRVMKLERTELFADPRLCFDPLYLYF